MTRARIVLFLIICLISIEGKSKNYTSGLDSSLVEYSDFSELIRNRKFVEAIPPGMAFIVNYPGEYARWIYPKLEYALWYAHDSTDASDSLQQFYARAADRLYDMALFHYGERAEYFQSRKATIADLWLNKSDEDVIREYERAIALDTSLNSRLYSRLALRYESLSEKDPKSLNKAAQIYLMLLRREPKNTLWQTKLTNLPLSDNDLFEVNRAITESNPDDFTLRWNFVLSGIRNNQHSQILSSLEYLVNKSPTNANYLSALANTYTVLSQFTQAQAAFENLIQLDSKRKEHYRDYGVMLKKMGLPKQALMQFEKSYEVSGKTWSIALYEEAKLYSEAADSCGGNFEDKIVYLLAYYIFSDALEMDKTNKEIASAIEVIRSKLPAKSELEQKGYRAGRTVQISGDCYRWINRTLKIR